LKISPDDIRVRVEYTGQVLAFLIFSSLVILLAYAVNQHSTARRAARTVCLNAGYPELIQVENSFYCSNGIVAVQVSKLNKDRE